MRIRSTRHIGTSRSGIALIETALTLPLLLLLFLNLINFGFYIYGWITVNNAARAAAEYQVYNGVAVGFPGVPAFSQICSGVWQSDVSSLYSTGASTGSCGWTNVTLQICSNRNGATSCSWSGSGAPPSLSMPSDPEPTLHVLYMADVVYHYSPIIPVGTLPVVNVPLTLGPSIIERQVVMRGMQ
jgi:hypothetical protein